MRSFLASLALTIALAPEVTASTLDMKVVLLMSRKSAPQQLLHLATTIRCTCGGVSHTVTVPSCSPPKRPMCVCGSHGQSPTASCQ